MKKILLTGAAGFIGCETAKELLREGYHVVGIDNLNDYYDVRLKEHRLESLQSEKNFEFIKMDIENAEDLKGLFQKHSFEGIINLAARAGVRYSMEHPEVYLSTNTLGTLNLLNFARDHKIKKFVLASTSSLYAGQEMPFSETLAVNTPISPYAATKKGAESLAYSYHYLYGIDVTIVRYFTVYGPAGRPDMSVFRFIKHIDNGTALTLFGDGTQSRDFTFVTDIAKGTVKALKPLGYEIINLGGGKNPVSINEVIQEIEHHFDKKAVIDRKPFHSADLKETWAEISKAARLLDWSPKVSLDEGLKKSLEWYTENKELVSKIEV